MPAALIWTASRDNLLISLRAEGRSWDSIAAALGLSRWAAVQRGHAIGAQKPATPPALRAAGPTGREALPPGHPVTWGAITAGTLLAGMAYPIPPLLERRAPDSLEPAPLEPAPLQAPLLAWAA